MKRSLIDYSAALSMATERLSKDPTALAADVLVVLPEDLDLGHMELALVQALPADVLITLQADQPGEPPDDVPELVSDASLLAVASFARRGPCPAERRDSGNFPCCGRSQ